MAMAEAVQTQTSRGPRQKVLIIEDDADIRELIKFNLEQDGYAVEEASTGAEGLERIKRRQPDLVLLDLMLPGMPGLEICRVLRGAKETAALPILIVMQHIGPLSTDCFNAAILALANATTARAAA